ncbi:MAG: hypothetical protein KME28_21700 [Pelatocladus maniniholoensis HA4357-MV3]|jgi:hypothetical protein|uniref:Uncharacterized protein n=1 Tax=Pelatocladus maniniholoensis HA4357-MV3 TaxID=1117104 RepID=A0A9E3HCH3_9NOST|nr:hypothetical protein [Pelatocladus maniniholoensis HA4357-MV3]BAZ66502.1 hypothetical protein NIES4106_12540 [Fischerella sp. NIES-4106]
MNYKKLDAALAMTLNQVQNPDERSLVVFIHTQPGTDISNAAAILKNLVISENTEIKNVFSATLSLNEIAKLSEQPWVQYLKLSQKLRLVDGQLGLKSISVNKF